MKALRAIALFSLACLFGPAWLLLVLILGEAELKRGEFENGYHPEFQ